ncbi:MAG: hypothetical protein U0798_06140 [Gemmataceae bacterium]
MTSEERTFDDALAAWKRAAVPASNADLSERVTQAPWVITAFAGG